jgi:hypothetical protein
MITQTVAQHHNLTHGFCAHGELRGDCTIFTLRQAKNNLVLLSDWIDNSASNSLRDTEAKLWGRVSKIGEEFGETIAALIGATGQNPRKGITHDLSDVRKELLDVAVTALGAVEHIDGHGFNAIPALLNHINSVWARAEAAIEKDNS